MAPQSIVIERNKETETRGPWAYLRGKHDSIMKGAAWKQLLGWQGSKRCNCPSGEQEALVIRKQFLPLGHFSSSPRASLILRVTSAPLSATSEHVSMCDRKPRWLWVRITPNEPTIPWTVLAAISANFARRARRHACAPHIHHFKHLARSLANFKGLFPEMNPLCQIHWSLQI